jgi:hypothetical protein
MKLILDTFTCEKYTFPINRIVPQPEDVKEKLSYTDYVLAIELLIVDEATIRKHLRVGSTPPTKISCLNVPEEYKRIQKLVYDNFGLTYICR